MPFGCKNFLIPSPNDPPPPPSFDFRPPLRQLDCDEFKDKTLFIYNMRFIIYIVCLFQCLVNLIFYYHISSYVMQQMQHIYVTLTLRSHVMPSFEGVWNYSNYFWGFVNLCGYFLGVCQFWQVFLGVIFQNIAFCKVFCDIFMKKCSKFLVSIKVLYKLNSFVAYFCQHHWLLCMVLVFCWVWRNGQVFSNTPLKSFSYEYCFTGEVLRNNRPGDHTYSPE